MFGWFKKKPKILAGHYYKQNNSPFEFAYGNVAKVCKVEDGWVMYEHWGMVNGSLSVKDVVSLKVFKVFWKYDVTDKVKEYEQNQGGRSEE